MEMRKQTSPNLILWNRIFDGDGELGLKEIVYFYCFIENRVE